MRVIIITSSSNRSGGTRQAVYQAQGLSERGHDVALCLPHDSMLWELPNAASNPLWHDVAGRSGTAPCLCGKSLPLAGYADHRSCLSQ